MEGRGDGPVSKMFATQAGGSESDLQNPCKKPVLHLLTQPDERETGDRRFPRQHVWMHWQAPASLKYPVWKIKVESRRGRYSMSAYTDVNL